MSSSQCNTSDYMRREKLPDDIGTSVKVVQSGQEMFIAGPAHGRKQHPNMQLRYCHTWQRYIAMTTQAIMTNCHTWQRYIAMTTQAIMTYCHTWQRYIAMTTQVIMTNCHTWQRYIAMTTQAIMTYQYQKQHIPFTTVKKFTFIFFKFNYAKQILISVKFLLAGYICNSKEEKFVIFSVGFDRQNKFLLSTLWKQFVSQKYSPTIIVKWSWV